VGVVGEIRRALERDEPVEPPAAVVFRAEQISGSADVIEREREEQLLRVAPTGGGKAAKLLVVEVRAGDRLGEDGRVRRRTGHAL